MSINDPFELDPTSPTSNSNYAGANIAENCSPSGINNALRALGSFLARATAYKSSDLSSSVSTNIAAASTGLYMDITGANAINSLGAVPGANANANVVRILQFDSSASLSHSSGAISLLGGFSRRTQPGDIGAYIHEGSGGWRELFFSRAVKPAFSAHKNGTDQASVSTTVKITFGTEVFDDAGNFASSTFTAPTAGRYRLTANIHWTNDNAVDVEALQVFIYKNGSAYKFTQNNRSGSGASSSFISILADAVAGDTFEVYGTKGGAGTGTADGVAVRSYFMGELVGL